MAAVIISPKNRPQPVYGFDNITDGDEVTALVTNIRKSLGSSMNNVMIYILSGTHGDQGGNLVGEGDFYQEDKLGELQTVKAANVNETTPSNTWANYFGKTKSIVILAWCYSNKWSGLATYNK